jgi:hypothetical protein
MNRVAGAKILPSWNDWRYLPSMNPKFGIAPFDVKGNTGGDGVCSANRSGRRRNSARRWLFEAEQENGAHESPIFATIVRKPISYSFLWPSTARPFHGRRGRIWPRCRRTPGHRPALEPIRRGCHALDARCRRTGRYLRHSGLPMCRRG